jgi:CyaY protein
MDDQRFDKLAADELHHLEDLMEAFDPDDVEVDVTTGVVSLTVRDGTKIVVNSHRAAREIWMAAVRQAWHFGWDEASGRWKTPKGEELRSTLARVIGERLSRQVTFD